MNGAERLTARQRAELVDDDPIDDRSSYLPVDLSRVDPKDVPPPTILESTDGAAHFYKGRTNMLMAESEAGKTWLAYHAGVQVLDAGGRLLVIDYEDEAATFKGRMLALGVLREVLDDPSRVVYVRPDEPLQDHRSGNPTRAGADLERLLGERFDLAIIDGVTDAMTMEGLDPVSNADISHWHRLVPKAVALRTGAAALMLDHYAKQTSDRRYALGGQHKRNMISGASYGLDVTEPIGRGKTGGGRVIVGKDRPGYVRGRATKVDKELVVSTYTVSHDETTGRVSVHVDPFLGGGQSDEDRDTGRNMDMVKRMHEALRAAGVSLSGRGWKGMVTGNDGSKAAAIDWLKGHGYVLVETAGRSHMHRPNPAKPADWLL